MKNSNKEINLNDDKEENLDFKALAFVYNMIYVGFSNNGELDNDAINEIDDCLTDIFNIEDPIKYFGICFEQFQDEYINKKNFIHETYLKSLSNDEIEDLFHQLLRLILTDRKLNNLEFNALQNIASLCNLSSENFSSIIEKFMEKNYLLETTENYYHFLSYLELFNSAMDRFDSHEYETAIKAYEMFITMISQDKLFFGKLIDEKIYIEGYGDNIEVLPLENFYFNRSQCYSNLGDDIKALADLKRALEINPNVSDPRFFHNIGTILFKLDDHTNCIKYFDKAIELDDISSSESYYMRAGAYLSDKCEIQNKNKFIEDMNKYLEFNPEDLSAINLLKKVNNIIH